uniref:Aldose 1-epimerase n=1 Tax=Musca domestica TaxID=7370 RepID=T1PFY0_MUSDO
MVNVKVEDFGSMTDPMTKQPKTVKVISLTNDHQMTVQVLTLGVNIASVRIPDKAGKLDELSLSFDTLQGYIDTQPAYIGATMGRVANRVANGRFKLNGQEIQVTKNFKDKYQLHGGFVGFDSVIWDVVETLANGVVLRHVSPDGHEGYPGVVTCNITCTLNDNNEYRMQIEATTDKTTCVNVTNHAYFNLAGHNSGKEGLGQHLVQINADEIVDTDLEQIPTGKFVKVENTVYDLRNPAKMSDRLPLFAQLPIKGYDNCYCVKLDGDKTTRIARVEHPESGRWLEMYSNQPGVQFYTSNNFPDVENGAAAMSSKGGAKYVKHGAFCLETQKYPDSMNHENFPSIFLNPGEKYYHDVIYKFGN